MRYPDPHTLRETDWIISSCTRPNTLAIIRRCHSLYVMSLKQIIQIITAYVLPSGLKRPDRIVVSNYCWASWNLFSKPSSKCLKPPLPHTHTHTDAWSLNYHTERVLLIIDWSNARHLMMNMETLHCASPNGFSELMAMWGKKMSSHKAEEVM